MKGHTLLRPSRRTPSRARRRSPTTTSATAVAASGSRARASSRFQKACRKAAARAKPKAEAGIVGAAYDGRPMGRVVRAVAFDFNGTLSHDEPIMCADLRAALRGARPSDDRGRVLRARSPGNTEEAIIGGWLGVEGDGAGRARRRADPPLPRRGRRRAHGDGRACARPFAYAAARVPVAVVSGAYREEIEPVLDGRGHRGAVRDARHRRRRRARQAASRRATSSWSSGSATGSQPAEVVVFEDTEAGIAAAKGAGVALHRGSGHAARRAPGARRRARRPRSTSR